MLNMFKKFGNICLASGTLLICTNISAIELTSNYAYFSKLSTEQETNIGIITPPDSAELVTTHKGIKIYQVKDRKFTEDEINQITRLIDVVPKKMLSMPPKAIIAASKETRGRIYQPNMVATASGPYIFLGDKFFIGGFRSKNTINDRLQIFMHEYAHVIQHYYLDTERGSQTTKKDRSTLVFDFAVKMGWAVKKGFGEKRKILTNEEIPFNPKSSNSWFLPEDKETDTSKYGRTNTVEDQAESFGWVIAGHPTRVSKARVDYVLDYLGESLESFTQGKIPLHKKFKRARSKRRGLGRFFDEHSIDQPKEVNYYFIEQEDGITIDEVLAFFSNEFKARGFNVIEALDRQLLAKNKEGYTRGIYEFGGEKIQIQILDYENAMNYRTKGETAIEIVRF